MIYDRLVANNRSESHNKGRYKMDNTIAGIKITEFNISIKDRDEVEDFLKDHGDIISYDDLVAKAAHAYAHIANIFANGYREGAILFVNNMLGEGEYVRYFDDEKQDVTTIVLRAGRDLSDWYINSVYFEKDGMVVRDNVVPSSEQIYALEALSIDISKLDLYV